MPQVELASFVRSTRSLPFLDHVTYRITLRRSYRRAVDLCEFLWSNAIQCNVDETARIDPAILLHGVPDLDLVESLIREWWQQGSYSAA